MRIIIVAALAALAGCEAPEPSVAKQTLTRQCAAGNTEACAAIHAGEEQRKQLAAAILLL